MKHNIKCSTCKKEFTSSWSHQKTCSEECRKGRENEMWGRYVDKSIPAGTVGAISELAVSVDLMEKGYAVFRALSQSCFCDVIAIKGNKQLRIEIRTGYITRATKKLSFPTITHGEIDAYGIYERNENKCYYFNKKLKEIKL